MDIILYNIGAVIIVLLVSYLFGSIPNAIWIGKVFFHKDVRDYGSGNAGGTNAGRVFGKKIGLLVIFLDGIKLIAPLYIFWAIFTKAPIYNGEPLVSSVEKIYIDGINNGIIQWPVYWLAVIGCSLGHCYPVFAQFKGGKNVASFAGIIAATSWLFSIIDISIFLGTLKAKKYVSLASIIFSWVSVIMFWTWAILLMTKTVSGSWAWFINYGPSIECNYVAAICVTFEASLLTFKHKENIKRLKEGTERKITWMK